MSRPERDSKKNPRSDLRGFKIRLESHFTPILLIEYSKSITCQIHNRRGFRWGNIPQFPPGLFCLREELVPLLPK